MADSIFADPRNVTDLKECHFYHTMDIPGLGEVRGDWDLRGGERDYLGRVDFEGKRVLEVGVASGFLSFYMERHGAEVIGYDLSDEHDWDVLPDPGQDRAQAQAESRSLIRKINNAYWLAHRASNSGAKVVYGTVYEIPEEIGPVDVSTVCSVLLHVRDPFLALQNALRLTRETAVVTELFRDPRSRLYNMPPTSRLGRLAEKFRAKFGGPAMVFVPPYQAHQYANLWWYLSPEVVQWFLGLLGFRETKVTYHLQRHTEGGRETLLRMYTVVGKRTTPMKHFT